MLAEQLIYACAGFPTQPLKSGETRATAPAVILLFGGALFSTMVTAESTAVPSEEIPEIVVTAQKREQRAQDIAISISAITGDEIDRLGDRDFHDILLSIPGVSYSGEEAGLSRYSGESFINLPLIDNRFALRLGGAYRFDAGYVDNIPEGQVQVWTRSATLLPAAFEPVTYSGLMAARAELEFRA